MSKSSGKLSPVQLIKSFTYMLGSSTVTLFLYLGITLALAYLLSPRDYGIFITGSTFVNLFSFFFEFGFRNSILKLASEHKSGFKEGLNIAIGNSLLIKAVITIPLGFLIYYAGILAKLESDIMFVLIAYIFILSFENFAKIFGIARRALGQFKLMASINVFNRLSRLALIFIVLKYFGGLKELVLSFLILYVLRFLLSYLSTIRLIKPKVDLKLIKTMIKESYKFGIYNQLEDLQSRIDRVMINQFLGPAAVAFYAVPAKINRFTKVIPLTVSQVFLPTLHSLYEESKKEFTEMTKNLSRLLAILGVFALFGIYYFAEDVLVAIFDEKYLESISIVKMFSFISLVWFLDKMPSLVLASEGAHRKRLTPQIACTILNVILNIILIPMIGVMGAVYATLISNGIKLVIVSYYTKEHLEIQKNSMIVVLALLLIFFLPFTYSFPILLVSLFASKLISKEDFNMIRKAFKNRKKLKIDTEIGTQDPTV